MSSVFSVLGAVTGLYVLFLLALVVTSRHERTMPRAFAGPPRHVRVLQDEPRDPSDASGDEHKTFVASREAA